VIIDVAFEGSSGVEMFCMIYSRAYQTDREIIQLEETKYKSETD
jgi:hypothetical protein